MEMPQNQKLCIKKTFVLEEDAYAKNDNNLNP